jgi:hypothetical protein
MAINQPPAGAETRIGLRRPALEYSAKSLVRVEFFTRSYQVSGDAEVNRWRLADVLNDKSRPYVLLRNAARIPLGTSSQTSNDLARAAQYLQVMKEAIVFAIPHETPEMELAKQQYLAGLYADRSQVGATAMTPPFEIHGMVHLRRLAHLRQALEDLPVDFIPMTHVEAVYLPDPRMKTGADLAVINRRSAELFALSVEGARPVKAGFSRQ